MAKDYDIVEHNIADSINKLKGQHLPKTLPDWLIRIGVVPDSQILGATDIGAKSSQNKTDILVELHDSEPIKLSVKKLNADYYGNWYGHVRVMKDFGKNGFEKLTQLTTNWANDIKSDPTWESKPFVGVSISFGKRSGKTKAKFSDVFDENEILTIIRGEGSGDNVANSLIVTSDGKISSPSDLISKLEELNIKNILSKMDDFNIVFRPINPMTEKSNRGKNVFTRFVPYKKLNTPKTVTTMSELNKLGSYQTVSPVLSRPVLSHEFVLKDLRENYNIFIPTKK